MNCSMEKLLLATRGTGRDRTMAPALQHDPTSFFARTRPAAPEVIMPDCRIAAAVKPTLHVVRLWGPVRTAQAIEQCAAGVL